MCEKCDDLRSKLEAKVGALTEGEFKGAKVIAAMGADFDTIVSAVQARRNGESVELPADAKEAVKNIVSGLATALKNVSGSKMAGPDEVEALLGRSLTDDEADYGYKMAIHGKSAEEIVAAINDGMPTFNEANDAAVGAEADLPDEIKQLIQTAKDAGAEVRVIEINGSSSLGDALKQAMGESTEVDQDSTDQDSDDEEVVIRAIAMFDEDGTPVSVDMVHYVDYLEMEQVAEEAVATAEEAADVAKQLQAQLERFKQLRDAVGEFANKTFGAESGEAVRAGHFLNKEVLAKFPDLYK